MKTRLNFFAIFLGAMLVGLPHVANAQFVFTTNNGAITITGYTGPGGSVTIPAMTNGWPVVGIGTQAFEFHGSVTNVTIPGSVTNIGDYAFNGCSGLTGIYLQGNATGLGLAVFAGVNGTVYYQPGTSGWSSSFGGRPAVMLNPLNASGSLKVTISPSAAITAGAQWQVDGGIVQPSGATVLGLSVGNHSVSYNPLNGWAMPASQIVAIRTNVTTNVTVTYGQLTYSPESGAIAINQYTGDGGAMILPSAINGRPVVHLLGDVFQFCRLASVTIPSSITNISSEAFKYCDLPAIIVDPANLFYSTTNGVLFNKKQTVLIEYPYGLFGSYTIPQSVTNIGMNAFAWCDYLTGVTIGTNVTGLGYGAFFLCYSLHSVTLPNSITSIPQNAFENCSFLTSVTLGTNVTSIGSTAFIQCGLTSVTIPASVTSIGGGAFSFCRRLTAITVDPANSIYSSADGVLFNKDQSKLIQYPTGRGGSYAIPPSVIDIGNGTFGGCGGLTNITIGANVTNIEGSAFYECSGLTSITIGPNVTTIGDRAFDDCSSLSGIYFPGNAPGPVEDGYLLAPNSTATVYYLPGTTGWPAPGDLFGGCPTALWLPQTQTGDASFGVQTNQFGFNITWAADKIVVVEVATNLANPDWQPVSTNALTDGSSSFSDSDSTNYPARFYRLRTP